uniref:Putative peritrophin-like protein n=1 Tax=Nyssomyia neivai TaxID=330878 RepID=A0A1L8E484_9DIPT
MSSVKVIFLLFFHVAPLVVQCEQIVPGIPVHNSSGKFLERSALFGKSGKDNGATTEPPKICETTVGIKCKDCYNTALCLGSDPPLKVQNCGDLNPSTPYCVNNFCSATRSETDTTCVNQPKSDFVCTGVGYYPDPNKCTRYYICPGPHPEVAVAYECPTNYVYKSKARGCGRKQNTADCATVDCSKTPNELGTYLKDPAYYYFCSKTDKETRTIVFKCPDEENMEFDVKSVSCSFRCTKEGNFVNVQDPTKYFYCYRVGSAFQVDEVSCPKNFFFDPTALKCIKKT